MSSPDPLPSSLDSDHQLGIALRELFCQPKSDPEALITGIRELAGSDHALAELLGDLLQQRRFLMLGRWIGPDACIRGSADGRLQGRNLLLAQMHASVDGRLFNRLEVILNGFLDLSHPPAWNPDALPEVGGAAVPLDAKVPPGHQVTASVQALPHQDGAQTVPSPESPWVFWRSVLITLAVALGIRQFLLEARYIPSGSMLPGLQIQDRLLVEKVSLRLRPPQRGEIVVFHAPHRFDPVLSAQGKPSALHCLFVNIPLIGSLPGLQHPACDAFIKRVIALPGERVSVDPRGRVRLNGQALVEPYVRSYCPVDRQGNGPCRTLEAVVPPGSVLVLGDNRANSWDGRFWPGGHFLPREQIIGRAFWRFLPLKTWGALGPTSPPSP